MKKAIIKSEGNNYSAIEIGKFNDINQYSFPHPKLEKDIPGKLFISELIKSTGTEISIQALPPNTDIQFLHSHKEHEEIYIFLKGSGQFQVDNDLFDIQEGSIVRIAPNGKRTWRNKSDDSMLIVVIQAKAESLQNYYVSDGFNANGQILR